MRRRIAAAAAGAAMLAAGVLAAAGPVSAAGATGYVPHRCYVSALAAEFRGAQAGLGNRGFLLTLTDVSGASCHLRGYPRLELLDAARRALHTRVRRGPTYFDRDPGPRLIVLSPGETASADISFGVAGNRANPVLATYLEVSPPGAHRGVVLRIPGGPVPVYRGQAGVTAMARHTPYFR
jgi:hypothetical protein